MENLSGCELLSELYFYLAFAGIGVQKLCRHCCELLSDPSVSALMTSKLSNNSSGIIVFLPSIRRPETQELVVSLVVNCFQNCIFT